MKPGWTVVMQIQQRGKWMDPLPGMDLWRGWFATRAEARWWAQQMNAVSRVTHRKQRFVLRRAVR